MLPAPSPRIVDGEQYVTLESGPRSCDETIQTLTLFETKNFATLLKTKRPFKLHDHSSSQEAPI